MKKALSTTLIIALSAIFIFSSCKKDKDDEPTPTAADPTFTLPAGTYDHDISVGMTCATDGASIYYTTDGSEPSDSSTEFTSDITITETTTLKAISCKDGYNSSGIVEAEYIIEKQIQDQVKTPLAEPGSCTFKEAVHVSISCPTEDAEVRYTLDGSEPTSESELYQYTLVFKETTTLKAKAFKDGMTPSETATFEYTKEAEHIQTPEFIYPGGTFVGSKVVAIRCLTDGASIYYTTDGSTPTDNSTQYVTSFRITESTTVKAIAYKEGLGYSDVAEEHYEIVQETVANPTFSITGGTFNEPVTLTLSCATEGATIHFTLNGDEPKETSPVFSEPLTFSQTTTVKSRAFKDEYEPSDIVEQTYVIVVLTDGTITVVNPTGTHEYVIAYVAKKGPNTLIIKTEENNEMTLDFEHLETETFNFPTFENDPNATCTGTFVYSKKTLKFINGGEISVVIDGNNYTLTINDIEATTTEITPSVEHISLRFTGNTLKTL